MSEIVADETTLCPSSRSDLPDSVIFGVVSGTVEDSRVAYLKKPLPVTDELIAKAHPVTPEEVFRTASSCATKQCQHFDGQNCRLAERIVDQLPTVVEDLPACSIRRDCRWWKQEGRAACLRCPQVVTDNYNPSELVREVSTPV